MNISYNFYVKKIFYACYVKNVVLPIDILKNERNKLGIKNIGNNTKLRNNNVRTKCKLVQKALHNFYNARVLSFLTLTYHKNETDIKKAKHDLQLFFKRLKRWWNDPKRAKHLGELRYFYVYEYQKRGAVHFHILFNRKIPYSMITTWWTHAGNNKGIDLKVVHKGTNEFVVKYLSKYVTKVQENIKSLNQKDVGVQAYSFSRNCRNPLVVRGTKMLSLQELVQACAKAKEFYLFKTKPNEQGVTNLIGGSYDYVANCDYFKDFNYYVSLESLRFRYWLKNTFNKNDILDFIYKIFDKSKIQKIFLNKRILH
ncbi:rolling circle replication-associated protein [Spiroplasma endosymbiont of Tiphia femorata]|uniref:rolling circle replication-associated protein n=3 Tax=Spiroplasma endosymbiont of Tiphia femorata TaxID=3066326 RepID=UPI0030CDAAA3